MGYSEPSTAEPIAEDRRRSRTSNTDPREQPSRGRSRWFWLIISLLILAVIFGGLAAAGVLLTHEVNASRTVNVGSAPRLVLTSRVGSVRITSGLEGRISVVMHQRMFVGNDNPIPVRFELSPDGNTLTITTDQSGRIGLNLYDTGIDFDIVAPTDTALNIHTESGSISASGIQGQMTLVTSSGDVSTDGGSGQVTLTTTSGDITATDVSGQIVLSASSGSITAENASGNLVLSTTSGDVTATSVASTADSSFETSSGEITYSGTLAPGTHTQFQTTSGDVHLTLPHDAAFQVRASTADGSIKSDFSTLTILSGDGAGAVGSGATGSSPYAEISVQVSSGNIDLLAA